MNGKKLIVSILAAVLCLGIVAFLAASPGTEEQPTTITVSAAASLTEAFTDIAKEFEAAHTGHKNRTEPGRFGHSSDTDRIRGTC